MESIAAVAIASGLAGPCSSPGRGALWLQDSLCFKRSCLQQEIWLDWQAMIHPDKRAEKLYAVTDLCQQSKHFATALTRQQRRFTFIGGDHSNAMGIWKGVMEALPTGQKLGLVWIDAHMDAHTFLTSPSGNLHGMPVAALLGQGDTMLKAVYGEGPYLLPENLVLVGVRSYEPQERKLLDRLGVNVIEMGPTLQPDQLVGTLQQAVDQVLSRADRFAISIDLDGIDPVDAPAVTTPVPDGIDGDAICSALAALSDKKACLGLEIAEFDSRFDHENKTEDLIGRLIGSLYGGVSQPSQFLASTRSRTMNPGTEYVALP